MRRLRFVYLPLVFVCLVACKQGDCFCTRSAADLTPKAAPDSIPGSCLSERQYWDRWQQIRDGRPSPREIATFLCLDREGSR